MFEKNSNNKILPLSNDDEGSNLYFWSVVVSVATGKCGGRRRVMVWGRFSLKGKKVGFGMEKDLGRLITRKMRGKVNCYAALHPGSSIWFWRFAHFV